MAGWAESMSEQIMAELDAEDRVYHDAGWVKLMERSAWQDLRAWLGRGGIVHTDLERALEGLR